MGRDLDVRVTVEALRDARALIAAQGDPDRDRLTEQLLTERLVGLSEGQIIDYLLGTLYASIITARDLAEALAHSEHATVAEVIQVLDVLEAHT